MNKVTNKAKDSRKERVPFGQLRTKLNTTEIPGYRQYWFSDKDTRIMDAEAAGYEFVMQHEIDQIGGKDVLPDQLDQGEKIMKVVGTKENGSPLHAYLMKIKREWYEEDKAKKARSLDEMELKLNEPNVENSYGKGITKSR
jgi:hypothetical protein